MAYVESVEKRGGIRWLRSGAALVLATCWLTGWGAPPVQAAPFDLFVADVSTDRVLQIDGETGALIRTVATFGRFDNPSCGPEIGSSHAEYSALRAVGTRQTAYRS